MTIVLQGIIHGKTIELERSPGIDDGQAVQIVLNVDQASAPPDQSGPERHISAAGMMADYTDDDDAVLEEIYQERKHDTRPEVGP